MKEKIFADGFIMKKPHQNAPDFVMGKLSIKVDDAVMFLQKHIDNGWVNLDMKKSKEGKIYLELNNWKPNKSSFEDDVPF